MHDITLINTQHQAIGECNPLALYNILRAIRPDVIFEELPPSYFSNYYLERSQSNLEAEAIRRYLEEFKAVNVPVDLDNIPTTKFLIGYQNAMERVLNSTDITNFRTLLNKKKHYTSLHGFGFLNSDLYVQYSDAVDSATKKGLKKINDEASNLAYQRWNEYGDKRENEMLRNIYSYSRKNNYNKAVFLLGAAHRKSIKKKIEAYQATELPKLNWVIYSDSVIL